VVSAANASKEEAEARVAYALRSGLAPRPEVYRLSTSDLETFGIPHTVYPPSVSPAVWPNFIIPLGLVPRDGVRAFVEIGSAPTETEIREVARYVRARYPGIHVATYAPRDPWAIRNALLVDGRIVVADPASQWTLMLAANSTRDVASDAKTLARRLGLDFRYFEERTTLIPELWLPNDTALLEDDRRARASIDACYRGGSISVEQMMSCSGYVLSPRTLANCLGDADALGEKLSSRILFETCVALPATPENVEAVLQQGFSLKDPLTLAAEYLPPIPELASLQGCLAAYPSDQLGMTECVVQTVPGLSPVAVQTCMLDQSGAAVARCLLQNAVPNGVSDAVACVVAGNRADLSCVVDPSTKQAIEVAQTCMTRAINVRDTISCWDQVLPGGAVRSALTQADCLSREFARDSVTGLVLCSSDDPNVVRAMAVVKCLESATDVARVTCLTSEGSELNQVSCVLANQADPLRCLPAEWSASARLALSCARAVQDPAAAIESCGASSDPRVRKAAACVVRANGDAGEMSKCVAQSLLQGEAGRLAGCFASSQGATSFALCAVAPSMNEEWRIASECAATSGGEPISFATCTGGRLTVRELLKCVGGKIGRDCFGPNNTIVKFFTNMVSDIGDLLDGTFMDNDSNEIVKALRGVEGVASDFRDGVKTTIQDGIDEVNNCLATIGKCLS